MQTEIPIRINNSFVPFLVNREVNNGIREDHGRPYKAIYSKTDRLEFPEGNIGVCTRDFTVYEDKPGNYVRLYRDGKDDQPYAVSHLDRDNRVARIQYLPDAEKYFTEAGNSFFHIEWEKILIQEGKLILHAACVSLMETGGILFSGPSGAGKSTQADLWCRYAGAQMINGDRTILSREKEGWTAYGSPYAGSSRCYLNEECGVTAIVFVRKASKCEIRKLGQAESFQKIFSGVTVNSWDKNFVNQVCDLIEKLICEVPVYELSCTPDRQAVKLLYKELQKGRCRTEI